MIIMVLCARPKCCQTAAAHFQEQWQVKGPKNYAPHLPEPCDMMDNGMDPNLTWQAASTICAGISAESCGLGILGLPPV
jgi:hypothetical protein